MKDKNEGITLIALVITIIVMLILVGVTVSIALGEDGIVEKSRQAAQRYESERLKEELTSYKVGYYLETGMEISEGAIDEITETVQETGISPDKFIVYYDKHNIQQNKENENTPDYTPLQEEYVLFNWYKVKDNEEEIRILQDKGYKYLMGDVTGDGQLDENDQRFLELFNAGGIDYYEIYNENDYSLTIKGKVRRFE